HFAITHSQSAAATFNFSTFQPATFQPSNLPTFQPSNFSTFQPSNLPTFEPFQPFNLFRPQRQHRIRLRPLRGNPAGHKRDDSKQRSHHDEGDRISRTDIK